MHKVRKLLPSVSSVPVQELLKPFKLSNKLSLYN